LHHQLTPLPPPSTPTRRYSQANVLRRSVLDLIANELLKKHVAAAAAAAAAAADALAAEGVHGVAALPMAGRALSASLRSSRSAREALLASIAGSLKGRHKHSELCCHAASGTNRQIG
jgi:hypothetical protein